MAAKRKSQYELEIGLAARYAAWATLAPKGRAKHKHGVLFKTPHKLDMLHLVPVESLISGGSRETAAESRTTGGSAKASS